MTSCRHLLRVISIPEGWQNKKRSMYVARAMQLRTHGWANAQRAMNGIRLHPAFRTMARQQGMQQPNLQRTLTKAVV